MKRIIHKYICLLALALLSQPLHAQTTTFNATGGNQTYNVPSDGLLTITARGGDGGGDLTPPGQPGGSGATVSATYPVRQGDELIVVVGVSGGTTTATRSYSTPIGTVNTGFGGGGGGGSAAIIKRGGTSTLLLVAGGGGGSDGIDGTKPGGGAVSGEDPVFGRGSNQGGGFNQGFLNSFGGGGPGTLNGGGAGGGTLGGFGFGGGGSGSNSITLITATNETFVSKSAGGGGGYRGGSANFASGGVPPDPSYAANGGSSFLQTDGFSPTNITRNDGVTGGGSNANGSVVLNLVSAPPVAFTTPSVTNVLCAGSSTGIISVTASGGVGGYSYTLTPGNVTNSTGNFTGLTAGNYAIAINDASNGSANTGNISVNEPTAIVFGQPTVTNVDCNGNSTGAISITASGGTPGYTYTLSPGGSTNSTGSFTGLAAGNYTIGVTDANGCPANSGTVIVSEPAVLSLLAPTVTNVDCNGSSTGAISITASGGTPGYTYTLSPGGSTNNTGSFTGLAAGNYTIGVTDANGCTANSGNITVNEPPVLSLSTSGNTSVIFGFGSNCTTLTGSASGGTAPYSYAWSSGGTNASEQVCPGPASETYTVTATDNNGCQAPAQVTVNVQDVRCGNRNQNVTICYYGVTQCVSEKIASRYLKLGATIGGCGTGNARIGVEESNLPLQLSLKAYPNPVQDAVMVEVLSPNAGQGTFEVLDLTGRVRQSRTENLVEGLNEVEFRLGSLPTGIYLIKAVDALNNKGVVRVSKQ